jgi:hypothetical protein
MRKKFNRKPSIGTPDRTLDIPGERDGSILRKVQPRASPAEVSILIYGDDDNNFPVFQQVLSMVALEKWGDSARFITTGKAYEPDEIDVEAYDLANDPPG